MSPSAPAIVSLRNVDKTFESGTVALDGLNLDVREGEFEQVYSVDDMYSCFKEGELGFCAGRN